MEVLGSELEQTRQTPTVKASKQVNKVSPAKQSTSARKSDANRRNAQRSTGPKTLEGKRYSRMNALKHGLSAEAMFEEVVSVTENAQAYNDLLQQLRQHYKPVGAAEELEVERIARCWWKLQRASRYEDAEIRSATLRTAVTEYDDPRNVMPAEDQALIEYMCDTHKRIQDGGEIPLDFKEKVLLKEPRLQYVWPDLERKAKNLVNLAADLWRRCASCQRVRKEFEQLVYAPTRARKIKEDKKSIQDKQDLPSYRDRSKQYLETSRGKARLVALLTINHAIIHLYKYHQEALGYLAELSMQRQAIPTGEALERVLRYESAAERHRARAIDRLERLQRQRRGELVPPPLNVNLTGRN